MPCVLSRIAKSFWLMRSAAFGTGARKRLTALLESVAIQVALIVLAALLLSTFLGILIAAILIGMDFAALRFVSTKDYGTNRESASAKRPYFLWDFSRRGGRLNEGYGGVRGT